MDTRAIDGRVEVDADGRLTLSVPADAAIESLLKRNVLGFHRVADGTADAGAEVGPEHFRVSTCESPGFCEPLVVERRPVVDNADIEAADVGFDPDSNSYFVMVQMTPDGTRRFGEATTAMVKKRLAIVLDGALVTAPVVQSPILTGKIQIQLGQGQSQVEVLEASHALAAALGAAPLRATWRTTALE